MSLPHCAFCGWPAIAEDEDGTMDCQNCLRYWPNREDYLADLHNAVEEEWLSLPKFIREVMAEPKTERWLRIVAVRMFAKDIPAQVVEWTLSGLNQRAERPVVEADISTILIQAAEVSS